MGEMIEIATKNDTEDTKISPMCPVDYAFQRIGGKYKARILWSLNNTVMRYGELRRKLLDITPKMLTQVLRELEGDGLISRKVYYEVPPKVEYRLTDDGNDLIPFIKLASNWGLIKMRQHNIPPIER